MLSWHIPHYDGRVLFYCVRRMLCGNLLCNHWLVGLNFVHWLFSRTVSTVFGGDGLHQLSRWHFFDNDQRERIYCMHQLPCRKVSYNNRCIRLYRLHWLPYWTIFDLNWCVDLNCLYEVSCWKLPGNHWRVRFISVRRMSFRNLSNDGRIIDLCQLPGWHLHYVHRH